MEKDTPKILWIGNSPNRIAQNQGTIVSWEGLLGELEENLPSEWRCKEEEDCRIPLYVRAERLENYAKQSRETKNIVRRAWVEWYKKVAQLPPTSFLHRLIGKYAGLFNDILTTNYDYALEKCLNPSFSPQIRHNDDEIAANLMRKHGKIWHIHGEAAVPDSIVMRRKSYLEAIKYLCESRAGNTWLSKFLKSEVHVCGFWPGHEELLFWYALAERMNLPKEERKKVVVYFFYRADKDTEESEVMLHLFKTYDVEPIPVQVPQKDGQYNYEDAWKTVIGHLLLNCSDSASMIKPIHDTTYQLDKPKFSKSSFAVKSTTPTLQNPARCWMNIRCEKLDAAAEKGADYDFYCDIDDLSVRYSCSAEELKKVFENQNVQKMNNAPLRYSFYLDYRNGVIYSTVSSNDTTPVIKLRAF